MNSLKNVKTHLAKIVFIEIISTSVLINVLHKMIITAMYRMND